MKSAQENDGDYCELARWRAFRESGEDRFGTKLSPTWAKALKGKR